MEQCYVVLYDSKGIKCGGFDCKDAVSGLSILGRHYATIDKGFTYVSAACFYLKLDDNNPSLPIRQWLLGIH